MGMREGQKRKQQSKAPAEPRDSQWHSEVRGSHKTGKLDLDKEKASIWMPGAEVQTKSGRSFKAREEVVYMAYSMISPPLPQKPRHPEHNKPCPMSVQWVEPQPGYRRLLTVWGLS